MYVFTAALFNWRAQSDQDSCENQCVNILKSSFYFFHSTLKYVCCTFFYEIALHIGIWSFDLIFILYRRKLLDTQDFYYS